VPETPLTEEQVRERLRP
jgi:hypothetical protein